MADDLQVQTNSNTVDIGILQAKGKKAGNPAEEEQPTKISASRVRKLWNDGSRVVRPEQRTYWLNRNAVRGEQWVYWDKIRDKLTELPRDDRVRVTINKMGPASRSLSSKVNKRELVFEVVPQGSDDAAILAAQKAEAVLEDVHREHRWEQLREQEWWARWEGGTGILALDWDPKSGVTLGKDDDDDEDFGTGDIRETVLSIAECCAEPGERDIETGRYWIKASVMPPAKTKDQFRLKEMPPADAGMALSPFQSQVLSTDNRQVQVPMSLVLTYYERPNVSCPKGQIAVVVGDQVVQWSEWPFPFKDRLNLVCFREMKIQDRWNGDTILSSAQPVQTGYNASWSSILEHLKQASNARLAVPDTSMDSIDELTDNPGEMFFYNPAGPAPSYMAPPNMPAWWVQMPTLLDQAMQDILSLHDVNKGEAPVNLESGIGLSILGESDDSALEGMVKETQEGWQRYASMVLQTYAAKVTETRKARISGAGKAPRVVSWKGKDFDDNTDVRIPFDAILPESRAAAHARAQALWDRKIITDPKVYARIAQLPYTKDLETALDPDIAKAQRENFDMADGIVRIPDTWDDHEKHIATHNDDRKSEGYEHLHPAIKKIKDDHVQAHETYAAELAGTQQAKQMVHPALAQAPNADGQQPVPDGGVPLNPTMVTATAPPPAPPEPGEGGTGPAPPEAPQ